MGHPVNTYVVTEQVLAACVSACAAAPQGFYGLVAHPNGAVVPVDEPAVAAAKVSK